MIEALGHDDVLIRKRAATVIRDLELEKAVERLLLML